MAQRSLLRTGVGMVGRPGTLETHEKALPKTTSALLTHVQEIADAVNGNLSLGTGLQSSLAGNLSAQYIDYVFPATPDTEVQIPHGLGRVPIGYVVVRRDRSCSIYDSSPGSWGNQALFLKSSAASATVKLLVF